MIKKIVCIFVGVIVLSGCVDPKTAESPVLRGGVLKSSDGTVTFEPKIQAGEKNIGAISVLSFLIDPQDNQTLYIGSMKNGIFTSNDGGEQWKKMNYPPVKVYDMAINPYNTDELYATGVYEGRARIYKSIDRGENWEDVYGEPVEGTVILSLAIDRRNPDVLYAGTTTGMIIQSRNGGDTWINRYRSVGPITDIQVDPYNSQNLYALHYENEVLMSRDEGSTFENISKEYDEKEAIEGAIYSMAVDRTQQGVLFVGTDNGIYKGHNYGSSWEALNVIDSSKGIPIYAVSVSPFDNNELMYNVGGAIYRTADNGGQWHVYELGAQASVNTLMYDVQDKNVVYLGLRERK